MGTGVGAHIRGNVVGYVALFFALSMGGAWAATELEKNDVTSKVIKDGQVKNKDLANDAVTSPKVDDGSLLESDFAPNQLPQGEKGEKGEKGDPGIQGPSGETGQTGPAGPSTGPAGGDLTGNYPNPTLAAGSVTSSKVGSLPAAGATNNVDQTINNNTATVVNFATESFDTQALHSTSSNTHNLTAPIAGVYVITGFVFWNSNGAAGDRTLELRINNSGSNPLARVTATGPTAGIFGQNVSAVAKLAAGQNVNLNVLQNSGNSLNIISSASSATPRLAMTWVGPGA